jgi:hypothetical protein
MRIASCEGLYSAAPGSLAWFQCHAVAATSEGLSEKPKYQTDHPPRGIKHDSCRMHGNKLITRAKPFGFWPQNWPLPDGNKLCGE